MSGVRKTLRQFRKKRRDDLLYALARIAVLLFRALPLPLGIRIGGFLGRLAYRLLSRERQRALEHLDIAFSARRDLKYALHCPEMSRRERKRIAARCFENLGKNAVELVNFPRLEKDLDRRITLEGREYLDETLARGRGIIWITGHLGNWELMACYMATQGYPFAASAWATSSRAVSTSLS